MYIHVHVYMYIFANALAEPEYKYGVYQQINKYGDYFKAWERALSLMEKNKQIQEFDNRGI